METIPNDGLRPDDITGPEASWYTIGTFALTFNGYVVCGSFKEGQIESKPSQEGQEEEDARDAGADRSAGREIQLATIGGVRNFGARPVLACTESSGLRLPGRFSGPREPSPA